MVTFYYVHYLIKFTDNLDTVQFEYPEHNEQQLKHVDLKLLMLNMVLEEEDEKIFLQQMEKHFVE